MASARQVYEAEKEAERQKYAGLASAEQIYEHAIDKIVLDAKKRLCEEIAQGRFEIDIGTHEWPDAFVDDVAAALRTSIAAGERFDISIGVVKSSENASMLRSIIASSAPSRAIVLRLVPKAGLTQPKSS